MPKPSDRVNRFVHARREKRLAEGEEAAKVVNVSGFIRDPEVTAYIGKLLEIIDDLDARVRKLEQQPPIVSAPRSYLASR